MSNRTPGIAPSSITAATLRQTFQLLLVFAGGAVAVSAQVPPGPVAPQSGSPLPVLEKHVQPVYPAIAVAARVQGIVTIEASIAATGRVADARVVKSIPLLDNAALDAVRQWQFAQRADDGVLKRVIRVVFVLNNPDRYPRPAAYTSPLPSWIPANFAWTYKFQCRGEAVEIDSIARTVSTRRTADAVSAFSFDAADAADVFVMLVAGGFFDLETPQQTWKEQAEVKAGVQEGDDEIAVIVAVTPPPPPPGYTVYSVQPGGGGMRQPTQHTLSVRRNETWRVASWTEPVGKDSAPTVAAMSALGRRLREFVRTKVTDARQVPGC